MTNVYAEIDKLEKTLTEGRVYREYTEEYGWYLAAGIVLLLLHLLLASTWLRSLP